MLGKLLDVYYLGPKKSNDFVSLYERHDQYLSKLLEVHDTGNFG